jgi:hypothetical protein
MIERTTIFGRNIFGTADACTWIECGYDAGSRPVTAAMTYRLRLYPNAGLEVRRTKSQSLKWYSARWR